MAPAVTLAVGMHVWERARGLVDGIAKGPADAEVRHGLAVIATTSEVRELGLCRTGLVVVGLVVVESVAKAWRGLCQVNRIHSEISVNCRWLLYAISMA